MSSAVAELRKEGFRINGVNVQSSPAAAEKYGIRRLPTFIYFDEHDNEVRRSSGSLSKSSLRQLWRKSMF